MDAYAQYGLGGGRLPVVDPGLGITCGSIMAHGHLPLWAFAIGAGHWSLHWITGVSEEIGSKFRCAHPHAVTFAANLVDSALSSYPVTILLCE